jgi:diacylglycerol kinase (ATP)
MRYAIITNPGAGAMNTQRRRLWLTRAAAVLGAEIHGLDTQSMSELQQRARDLALRCDVLVIAGGDGTFSDIINSVDTTRTVMAYLPFGTGNAMGHALGYKGTLVDMACRIRDGKVHEYDLIACDEKRHAFMASLGIEGTIISLRHQYVSRGATGFKPYLQAAFMAYFQKYRRAVATISVDKVTFEVRCLLSLMIVKQPYYGFAMKVVPEARWDDRQLHLLYVNSGLLGCLIGAGTAFTIGNRVGKYRCGRRMAVRLNRPLALQIDGNVAWEADAFRFRVLPKALKLKC